MEDFINIEESRFDDISYRDDFDIMYVYINIPTFEIKTDEIGVFTANIYAKYGNRVRAFHFKYEVEDRFDILRFKENCEPLTI